MKNKQVVKKVSIWTMALFTILSLFGVSVPALEPAAKAVTVIIEAINQTEELENAEESKPEAAESEQESETEIR
jgi:hypothetical protein